MRRKRIVLGAAFLAIVLGSLFIFRPGVPPAAMLACLPPGDGPVLYVDVSQLRMSGLLHQIAGQPGAEDPEYQRFVEASGFDYRRDLDAALVELRSGGAFMVLKGRFDRARLEEYAGAHGGQCAGEFCALPGSRPERHISFHPMESRLLALASGSDPMAAASIKKNASVPPFEAPSAPIWMHLPASAFHAEPELPLGISAFLEALDGAQQALLRVEMSGSGFEIALAAPCESADKARTIADRLSRATATLKDLVARSGKPPEPASPAAILLAGTFSADQTVVRGQWPLSKAALEGWAK